MLNIKWVISAATCCFFLISLFPYSESIGASTSDHGQPNITIQVSSVKNAEDAKREVKRLKSHGLQAFMRHESVKNKGMWYRIYVGLFEDMDTAMSFADKLMKQKIISYPWVKEIKNPPKDIVPTIIPPEKPIKVVEKEPEKKPIEPTPPPSKVEEPVVPPPKEISEPPKVEEVKPKEIPSAKEISPEKITEPEVKKVEKEPLRKKFAIGLKGGAFFASGVDLEITRTSGGSTQVWKFNDRHTQAGLVLSYQLTDRFFLDGSYEKAFSTDLDLSQFTLGAGVNLNPIRRITPFINAGLIFGDLAWSDAPGGFDSGIGWKIGFGGYYPLGKIQIGLEVAYQGIEYDYNLPSESGVSATDDKIDFSGFLMSLIVRYHF